jgi:hypothetical protein
LFREILIAKSFQVICFVLIALMLQNCYSNFAIANPLNKNILDSKNISKIKLKDGSEFVLDSGSKLEFPNVDNMLIKNSHGTERIIALRLIDEVYESKIDEVKTFYTFFFGTVALYYVLHNFGIIKWPGGT